MTVTWNQLTCRHMFMSLFLKEYTSEVVAHIFGYTLYIFGENHPRYSMFSKIHLVIDTLVFALWPESISESIELRCYLLFRCLHFFLFFVFYFFFYFVVLTETTTRVFACRQVRNLVHENFADKGKTPWKFPFTLNERVRMMGAN